MRRTDEILKVQAELLEILTHNSLDLATRLGILQLLALEMVRMAAIQGQESMG